MPAQIVSLISDFGLKDPYVAEMKAVILSICPTATVVDVTHGVEKFNVRIGAFMLASAAPFFPRGTVHVAVVDPSVGTQRRPIIVETERGFFVGPDNGLLILAAEAQRIKQIIHIKNEKLMLPQVSRTFHGRDIFAPAAAHIANGVTAEEFGPKITDAVRPDFTRVTRSEKTLVGEVLYVDGFGNIITNIQTADLDTFAKDTVQVKLGSHTVQQIRLLSTYAEGETREFFALVGSQGYLEIALNQGSASERLTLKTGDKITLSRT